MVFKHFIWTRVQIPPAPPSLSEALAQESLALSCQASVDAIHRFNNLHFCFMYYVYLLKCNDDTIYTGCTSNIDLRLNAHKSGQVTYTKSRLPIELIIYIAFSDKHKAFAFEKYLKSGSGKAFANKRFL